MLSASVCSVSYGRETTHARALRTAAVRDDLPRLTEIYNDYVVNTPITFDIETYTVEQRESWFKQFSERGRYRLMVAEENGLVLGYAGTTRFRPKAAYETTVETTIYCAQEATGKGVGSLLYGALFEALKERTSTASSADIRFRIPRARLCTHALDSNPSGFSRR